MLGNCLEQTTCSDTFFLGAFKGHFFMINQSINETKCCQISMFINIYHMASRLGIKLARHYVVDVDYNVAYKVINFRRFHTKTRAILINSNAL